MSVDIIDIGSGNICSIKNWLERVNIQVHIINHPKEASSNFLILPGVGSAGPYMQRMKQSGFDEVVLEHVANGHRLLGICLGFQIMSDYLEEDGGVEGLGILSGKVEKLPSNVSHNSWEKFVFNRSELGEQTFQSKRKLTRKRIIDGRVFYNHEYGFISQESKRFNKSICERYSQYSSMVVKGAVIGVQFHPEKSQKTGLELISMIL